MAKVDASHAITISAHTTLGTSPIVHFGTNAQRKRYVPLLASGRVLGGLDSRSRRPAATLRRHVPRRCDGTAITCSMARRFSFACRVGRSRGDGRDGCIARRQGNQLLILTKETCDLEKARELVSATTRRCPRWQDSVRQEGGEARLARLGHARTVLRDVEVRGESGW